MFNLTRRVFGTGLLAAAAFAIATTSFGAAAQELKAFNIGYQKTGLPVIARQRQIIEKALAGKGVTVKWVEFTAGPPLVEALNVGAIDVGWTGDAPPIFGQSAGANIVYAAALPSNGDGEAIFVKPASPIQSLADLKGKRIGVGKGTSAHNLLVAALEKAGIAFDQVTPVYLSPADAAAAFASDQIDAWAVWDPFFAIAETRYQPRVLVRSSDVLKVNTYFLANKDFAKAHPDVVSTTIAALGDAAKWADQNRDKVAEALHEVTGVPLDAQTIAANRTKFGIFPITDEIVAGQQATADRFFKLGLIPKAVRISDAIWTAPGN
ncbi:sulfonate ABC transporter substrate-binding protein [Mesorhizobium humile]|uniref:Sulfonate ABC transporter substrate-binding protein n=1 Tax=Mesorhizobium humile TaxID=3072313 RepID=A0ABU4YRA9_9HYPH|nr:MULTISPECIES: sulfonate ABC transporter substrate-binding protein [unclassified Mesorhizobium]MDX8462860.1 sulfonate ABC transporter substrate-binding protein [Mesorhizobium sp. VK2D]MDX8489525.1 sulfonate ABC transporter substrate-binding protein [Mesorhizobium sp. VK2B]